MLPTTIKNAGQADRIEQIAPLMQSYDIAVISEAFDDDLRNKLIETMKTAFPYFTCILGHYEVCEEGDKSVCQDGGVIIFSKYPIVEQDQRLYYKSDCDYGLGFNDIRARYQRQECWGTDCQARKGVLYAKIKKDSATFHVFGSHNQASYGADKKYRVARSLQFATLNSFINERKIDTSETIIIAGDLNVDKIASTEEYNTMIELLNAVYPKQIGENYTYNPKTNCLAEGTTIEYLDYILYRRSHRIPKNSTIETLILKTKFSYIINGKTCDALSDHYPVVSVANFD